MGRSKNRTLEEEADTILRGALADMEGAIHPDDALDLIVGQVGQLQPGELEVVKRVIERRLG